MILGNKEYNYVKMTTSGYNVLLDPKPKEMPSYNIRPSEISKTKYSENGTKFVKYVFHELQIKKNPVPFADTKEAIGIARIEIIIMENDSGRFEDYLYPKSWEDLLSQKGTLTAAQIKIVREGIEKLTDQKQKEDDYLLLQTKVEYKNQRDNLPSKDLHKDGVEATADRMCNVTSLAMAFEMLGTSKEDFIAKAEKDSISIPQNIKDGNYEDLLDFIRNEKNYGIRTSSNSWDKLASYVGLRSETRPVNSSKNAVNETIYITDCLKAGNGIIVSIAYAKGHIVRLQNINNTEIIIDDPYGIVNSLAKREFIGIANESNSYNGNDRNMSITGKRGENCKLTWNELDVAIEEGKGGHEEVNAMNIVTWDRNGKQVKGTFETWLEEIAPNINEYSTRQEVITKVVKEKTINETIKYYITKGATIKYYKIYSKPKK